MMNTTLKCVVWDLDNTLWQGTLLEQDALVLNRDIVAAIKKLDRFGVVHSIASRNDFDGAMAWVKKFGLSDCFLYPQIHWGTKSQSIHAIAQHLNLGVDSFCFVDDQPFEREEVTSRFPQLQTLHPEAFLQALREKRFALRQTAESRHRRQRYWQETQRQQAQLEFESDNRAFLKSLNLTLTVTPLEEADLQRAEELTQRTHQLNTTGYTYTGAELLAMSNSPDYLILAASLTDRFGDYGTIGLVVLNLQEDTLLIKLFLLSCRVMNRGIAGPLLEVLRQIANALGLSLTAEYKSNGRNRQMLVTYRFAGFKTISTEGDVQRLQLTEPSVTLVSEHVRVNVHASISPDVWDMLA